MSLSLPSFAKINLGLRIGELGPDGFHGLRTVYQTIAAHDLIRVAVCRGLGIEIRCDDPRVPTDATNTCYQIAERVLAALKARVHVTIEIQKRLPVQGGLGGASGNAVAALLALERVLRKPLPGPEKLRIASEVGSDLPLFLVGGTVLGVGRGEEVYPLLDLPAMPCVLALPDIAVSTPKAFAAWDALTSSADCHSGPAGQGEPDEEPTGRTQRHSGRGQQVPRLRRSSRRAERSSPLGMTEAEVATGGANSEGAKLTLPPASDRMLEFSRKLSAWLSAGQESRRTSGVSAGVKGGGRAENLLLDLVRTGIENDFERVVFPQYPELREVKRVLERAGASYASLSGSGSAIYGLFESSRKAAAAAQKLHRQGTRALVTTTLTRRQYWKKLLAAGF